MSVPSSRLFLGTVSWYGLLITLGVGLAVLLADREARRQGLPENTAVDLALSVLPTGILGARLYYVLFAWETFRPDPLSVFRIWEGGLAIYGGLIAGVAAALLFCHRRKLAPLVALDLMAPGVALAQALGRWGNYFNQEAYGPVLINPVLQFFPLGVQIPERGSLVWHAAVFFYASLGDFLIFCLLMRGRRGFLRGRGRVFGCYTFCYAAGRLVLENLRADSLRLGDGIRISQLLSLCVCLAWLLCLYLRSHRAKAPVPVRCLAMLPLLPGIPALLFCLGLHPAGLAGLPAQMALLSCFSATALLCGALLFFSVPQSVPDGEPSDPPECPPQGPPGLCE